MNDYTSVSEVKVGLNFGDSTIPVGRLAIRDHKIYFEYHSTFIETSLNISPLRLPLKSGVSSFDYNLFEGFPEYLMIVFLMDGDDCSLIVLFARLVFYLPILHH